MLFRSPDARVVELAEILRPHNAAIAAATPDLAPTFFELITAAAWLEFALRRVDVTILETGLGGRLDATNLCQPEVCVITSIGLDHQEYLGPNLAHIAAEKAGILKPGVPAVAGAMDHDAWQAIAARAEAVGTRVEQADDGCAAGPVTLDAYGAASFKIGRAHV